MIHTGKEEMRVVGVTGMDEAEGWIRQFVPATYRDEEGLLEHIYSKDILDEQMSQFFHPMQVLHLYNELPENIGYFRFLKV